jgi:hypothetical protein
VVVLQHRADQAAAYVRACLWLWHIDGDGETSGMHAAWLQKNAGACTKGNVLGEGSTDAPEPEACAYISGSLIGPTLEHEQKSSTSKPGQQV